MYKHINKVKQQFLKLIRVIRVTRLAGVTRTSRVIGVTRVI